jgi:translation elongation factor EF-4
VRIGDTIAKWGQEVEALPGYKDPKKMVFCGIYPANNVELDQLKKALERYPALHVAVAPLDIRPGARPLQ